MNQNKSNNQEPLSGLTPELMEGYLKGTLSPIMRQKVERFLAEHPFEAEAMEGLKLASAELKEDLSDLELWLQHKINLPQRTSSRYFWPMAAAVSLLVISGLVFYFFLPLTQENSQVAVKQETSSETQTEEISDEKTTAKAEDLSVSAAKSGRQNEPDKEDIPLPVSEEKPLIEVPDEEEIEEEIEVNLNIEASAPERDAEDIPTAIKEPPAEAPPNHRELADNARQPGDEPLLEAPEAQALVDDRAQTKKTRARTAAPAIASQYGEEVTLPLVKAPDGFMDYLSRNISYPQAAMEKGIKGTVKITFVVNEKGSLGDFQVVQGLGYGCDQEVIKWLREGPAWKPAELNGSKVKSRGQVEVNFPPKPD